MMTAMTATRAETVAMRGCLSRSQMCEAAAVRKGGRQDGCWTFLSSSGSGGATAGGGGACGDGDKGDSSPWVPVGGGDVAEMGGGVTASASRGAGG